MLFSEDETPFLKAWIVKRLENNSDADAEVLAEYVLALLRHDGDVETIRKLFEDEIPDFLREDASAFTDDVFQAVKYRSYMPGAPPAPPAPPHRRQPHFPPTASDILLPPPPTTQSPYAAPPYNPSFPQPQGGSLKRSYNERDDNDVDIILTSRTPYAQPHPYKQARRGGGFNQRGGRYEDSFVPRSNNQPPSFYPMPPAPAPYGANGAPPLSFAPTSIDAKTIMDNIQMLQSLLPTNFDLSQPLYPGSANPPSRRRKQRCRDYDTKGYCSRGNTCHFEHGIQMPYLPPPGSGVVDEYDPNNAALSLPPFGMPLPPEMPQFDPLKLQVAAPANRQDSKKSRRLNKGRPPFAGLGPNHDRTKTAIVVQNIPNDNFTEDQIRAYFSQFGNIVEVSMQKLDRVATIKFDTWEAANAAWSSPKVIFDNRFVKVFWYKEEPSDGATSDEKLANDATNGHTHATMPADKSAPAEPDFDLDEFYRKTVEAQKIYEEKSKKRQEIERERQHLEQQQEELRQRHEEARRELRAKLKAKGIEDDPLLTTETKAETGDKNSRSQTEALRAQLAALEQEASQLGIDPDDTQDDATYLAPRGRGRGRGYRGRGTYVPRALRGSYGYRGRGGIVEARHAAYAAYSLDNRPKIVALSGVDFTLPENDEALRQYLFSVGEFKEVHAAPAVTHVAFKDRKTAEKFMYGVSTSNSIVGIEGKIEPAWSRTAPESNNKTADDDTVMGRTLDDEQATKEKTETVDDDVNGDLEEGEIDNTPDIDQRDMDYEAGEW